MHALRVRALYPERVHVVRIEDVMADPKSTLGAVCGALGLEASDTLACPTWNGRPLDEVSPWGTIRQPTLEANRAAADSLSNDERKAIALWASPYLDSFGYR
jgi:hypothetical protein